MSEKYIVWNITSHHPNSFFSKLSFVQWGLALSYGRIMPFLLTIVRYFSIKDWFSRYNFLQTRSALTVCPGFSALQNWQFREYLIKHTKASIWNVNPASQYFVVIHLITAIAYRIHFSYPVIKRSKKDTLWCHRNNTLHVMSHLILSLWADYGEPKYLLSLFIQSAANVLG